MLVRWVRAMACVGALASLAACASTPPPAAAVSAPASTEYRLGSGDRLRVIVFGEEALSREYVVSGTGSIAVPLIGDVTGAGLTDRELAGVIEQKLAAGFLKSPQVSVEVLGYRPFYILGEVNAPGEYPFSNGLTVVNAVATAKGYTYRADRRRVFIRRSGQQTEQEVGLATDVPVQPGDTIRIRERYF